MRGGIRTWGDTYMYLMYAYIYNIIEERVFNNVNLPKKEKKNNIYARKISSSLLSPLSYSHDSTQS